MLHSNAAVRKIGILEGHRTLPRHVCSSAVVWALHVPSKPENLRTDKQVAALEAAKSEFEASWQHWGTRPSSPASAKGSRCE